MATSKVSTIPQNLNISPSPITSLKDAEKAINDYISRWDEIYRYLRGDLENVFSAFVRRDGTTALTGDWGVGSYDITGIDDLRAATARLGGDANYSQFEADGTLEFNGDATVWDDYVVPMSRALFGGAANDPTLTKIADNGASSAGVWAFVFGDGDEVLVTVQMPHRWKEGTTIQPHIHFFTMTDVTPTDNFGIEFEYWWADTNEDFPANTTLETVEIPTGANSQYQHQLANITAAGIDGTGHTISSVLLCRIKRVAAVDDNYGGGVAIMDFDVHFEIDTVGSRQIATK